MSKTFKRKRGFMTIAQKGTHDFVRMAYALALGLKATQDEPYLSIMVDSNTDVPDLYRDSFDEVITIPWIDSAAESEKKIENDWKLYHVTPYEETIKIDADMLVTSSIDHWWPVLGKQDLCLCRTSYNLREEPLMPSPVHRSLADAGLPVVSAALSYFKYSDHALAFFQCLETVFNNYEKFSFEFMDDTRPRSINRDVCYSIAAMMMDSSEECFHSLPLPAIVSLKPALQNWMGEAPTNWQDHIVTSITPEGRLKAGNYIQDFPVNYDMKNLLKDDDLDLLKRLVS